MSHSQEIHTSESGKKYKRHPTTGAWVEVKSYTRRRPSAEGSEARHNARMAKKHNRKR